MVDYLPKDVRDGLDAARRRERKGRARMRLQVGGQSFTILRSWDTGFAVDAAGPPIRGLGDLYEDGRHVAQCLIVASEIEGDERVYEFKRRTVASDAPPADFAAEPFPPVKALPDHT